MILLVIAAAAAADISDEPFPVQMCHTNGFPATTCAAVKQDCAGVGTTTSRAYPYCYFVTHPYGITQPDAITALTTILNGINLAGCTSQQNKSFKGAKHKSTLVLPDENPLLLPSNHFAPSFPAPADYETSQPAGTSCKAPCTTAECDRFCDGAGCAAHCTGTGCAGGCTGDVCAYRCTGDRCAAGAVGRMAAAACNAPNCGTGCVGDACAAGCAGHGCGAMCTGRYCANSCGRRDPATSIGCGAHCVGENCAYGCQGLGCGVGARDKATDPFTTQCGDYKYEGHCGKLTALAGLRCAWRAGECVDDPPDRGDAQAAITTMTILATTALVGSAAAPK